MGYQNFHHMHMSESVINSSFHLCLYTGSIKGTFTKQAKRVQTEVDGKDTGEYTERESWPENACKKNWEKRYFEKVREI